MDEFLNTALQQAPALAIYAVTIGWLVRTFLSCIQKIADDHNMVMKQVLDRNTEALTETAKILGATNEALRHQ